MIAANNHELRTPDLLPERLTQRELAAHWRISPRTLERWRINGTGPAWIRLAGRVIYRATDIIAYERAQTMGGAPERAGP